MQNYHRLFWASQERYDKLVSLSSSGGAAGFKSVGKDSEQETVLENNNQIESVDSGIFMGKSYQSLNGSVESETAPKPTRISSPTLPRRVKKELSPLKPPADKVPKGTPEKLGKIKHDKSNDNFTVPKPPGPRKGVRRPLNLDHAVHKSGSTGALNGNLSNAVPHSPVVTTAPSSVDIAVTRRTQSR